MAILTTAEAKRAIYGDSTATISSDDLLTVGEIVAAVDVIVERVAGAGAMPTTARTWRGFAGCGPIVLPWAYASITSVTADGVTVSASSYDDETSADAGIVSGMNGAVPWSSGAKLVVVATVGQGTTPADVKRAAWALARHWGQLDRQGGRAAWADENGTPLDSAVPQALRDMLTGSRLPGFA